jgi:hypothetical protein
MSATMSSAVWASIIATRGRAQGALLQFVAPALTQRAARGLRLGSSSRGTLTQQR